MPEPRTGARYRRISIRMWTDRRFLELSRPKPNAQTLWIYLLTGPHTGLLPGLFVAGEAALAEALGWALPTFRRVFAEITNREMVQMDRHTRLVFLPRAVAHNPPANPNVVKAWRAALDELPECALRDQAENDIRRFLETVGDGFADAFSKASGKPFHKPCPIQEQEQEQSQEQFQETPLPPHGGPVDADRAWLDLLNREASRQFKATEANLRPIRGRRTEGYTLADAELVVRDRVRRWQGREQAEYLRPETIYGATKFGGYLEAAKEAGRSGHGGGDPRRINDKWVGAEAGEAPL
jgi:uncharacterized phage protein (TIGR02220 family)